MDTAPAPGPDETPGAPTSEAHQQLPPSQDPGHPGQPGQPGARSSTPPPCRPWPHARRRRRRPGRLLRRRPDDRPHRLRRPGLPRRPGRAPVPRRMAAHPRRGLRRLRRRGARGPRAGPRAPTEPHRRPGAHRPTRRHRPTRPPDTHRPTRPRGDPMRYRWDPAYPMGRRETQPYDAGLRASDDERNAVADKLSRHYAEGRLDEVEFKSRLDTAMSATTRGDLHGLFHDLPPLASAPPPPPPRHRRILPFVVARGAPGPRRRGDHPLLPDVPRAVAAVRPRGLRAVAPDGGPVRTGTPTTRAVTRARSWTTEPCAPVPPATRRTTDFGATLRSMALFAGLPGHELDDLVARCDVSQRPPGPGGAGPGRAGPPLARHRRRSRRGAARRHPDRPARPG